MRTDREALHRLIEDIRADLESAQRELAKRVEEDRHREEDLSLIELEPDSMYTGGRTSAFPAGYTEESTPLVLEAREDGSHRATALLLYDVDIQVKLVQDELHLYFHQTGQGGRQDAHVILYREHLPALLEKLQALDSPNRDS